MPLNLASPGIVVREVDLTVGRVDPNSDRIGAIVAPFERGPVDLPILIETEQDLYRVFGGPNSTDKQYEHWLTASSYLAYGGSLRVIRSDDSDLRNSFVGAAASIKIKSNDHYTQLGYDESAITGVTVAAKNPGSWANGVKVALIDGKADQIITGITTTTVAVGYGITQSITTTLAGAGTTAPLNGYLKGVVTGIGVSELSVKLLSYTPTDGTEVNVDYQSGGVYRFSTSGSVAIHTTGSTTSFVNRSYGNSLDWFDQQYVQLSNGSVIYWNNVADRPSTSNYAAARGSRFDELHIMVLDDTGSVSGNVGNILEKHLNLSKAKDAEYSVGSPSYWRRYLQNNSEYIFGGSAPAGITTISYSSEFNLDTDTGWDQVSTSTNFAATGSTVLTLASGKNYDGQESLLDDGALLATVPSISSAYEIFENSEEYDINFLLMGSANYSKEQAQSLANKLIAIAESRKDTVAFISPYRLAFINDSTPGNITINSAANITDNVISFYSPIASSSYAVFDSGYKYMYDKFGDTFRYVPLNGDMAGLCARNDIDNFPWFSPAGTSRGGILNAVKLVYNPSKSQRDRLYSNRVNPVIFSPGGGIVLFGDKTAMAKSSAFDRINVRRLFIYLEDAISAAAKDQLFEFNDEITRTNFVNIVEPFLRDVQAKRGIFDFRVICDESNNTASVIDNNEFLADIYIKPTRSINYIGLTFVATRSGVSFDEVIGTV
jgi:uncharacterized protein YaiE (UPF0345 family)